jgi:hypothetical protein
MRAALILLVLYLSVLPARAEDPVAAWLADDDATALPALAEAAAAGSADARILLALIDLEPRLQGHWLAAQDAAARRTLMRAPGGGSWMAEAAATDALARLWRRLGMVDAPAEIVLDFAALGEPRAARVAGRTIAARQQAGLAAIAADPGYPSALRYRVWREWARDPAQAEALAAEIAATAPGDPQRAAFAAGTVAPDGREAWLAEAPLAAPLRAFCDATCPATADACRRAAFTLAGGLHGLAALGSPLERLVSSEAFAASPRGRAALLRSPAARDPVTGPALASRVAAKDACTATALAAEIARFAR